MLAVEGFTPKIGQLVVPNEKIFEGFKGFEGAGGKY
jgi:hypothetical protein